MVNMKFSWWHNRYLKEKIHVNKYTFWPNGYGKMRRDLAKVNDGTVAFATAVPTVWFSCDTIKKTGPEFSQ